MPGWTRSYGGEIGRQPYQPGQLTEEERLRRLMGADIYKAQLAAGQGAQGSLLTGAVPQPHETDLQIAQRNEAARAAKLLREKAANEAWQRADIETQARMGNPAPTSYVRLQEGGPVYTNPNDVNLTAAVQGRMNILEPAVRAQWDAEQRARQAMGDVQGASGLGSTREWPGPAPEPPAPGRILTPADQSRLSAGWQGRNLQSALAGKIEGQEHLNALTGNMQKFTTEQLTGTLSPEQRRQLDVERTAGRLTGQLAPAPPTPAFPQNEAFNAPPNPFELAPATMPGAESAVARPVTIGMAGWNAALDRAIAEDQNPPVAVAPAAATFGAVAPVDANVPLAGAQVDPNAIAQRASLDLARRRQFGMLDPNYIARGEGAYAPPVAAAPSVTANPLDVAAKPTVTPVQQAAILQAQQAVKTGAAQEKGLNAQIENAATTQATAQAAAIPGPKYELGAFDTPADLLASIKATTARVQQLVAQNAGKPAALAAIKTALMNQPWFMAHPNVSTLHAVVQTLRPGAEASAQQTMNYQRGMTEAAYAAKAMEDLIRSISP